MKVNKFAEHSPLEPMEMMTEVKRDKKALLPNKIRYSNFSNKAPRNSIMKILKYILHHDRDQKMNVPPQKDFNTFQSIELKIIKKSELFRFV